MKVNTPAKINWFFEVFGKRNDGYHEIISVAVPVTLYDTLSFESDNTGRITFLCTGGSADIPRGESNIVVKAVQKMRERFGITQGAVITLEKHIPSQAGLGGGSSDAAAAIQLANAVWGINVDRSVLIPLAAEAGSDCPIFFYDTPTLSTGRGDIIAPLPAVAPHWFVLWKPAEGLSTAAVFRELDELRVENGEWRVGMIPDRCQIGTDTSRQFSPFAFQLFNRLEEPACRLWSGFTSIKNKMLAAGCLAVQMSGSGTAFFGLCRNQAHAETVAACLPEGEQLFVVQTV